ncbi:hypothetical protein F5Y14DRAFT_7202 [Nemania sp. NC0429]|nr:hypothetical protein F5Y14DRAFT_7202 [Nemania sp. NC0429]
MPSFQHDLDRDPMRRESADASRPPQSPPRRQFEEHTGDEDPCEGPAPESLLPSPTLPATIPLPSPPRPPSLGWTPGNDNSPSPSAYIDTDRAGLIKRLKRGEPPPWVHHRHHSESLWSQQQPPVTPTRSPPRTPTPIATAVANTTATTPTSSGTIPPTLLPPLTITPEKERAPSDDERRCQDGMKIERPRSALHSGDFTHDETSQCADSPRRPAHALPRQDSVSSSHSWVATSPPRDFAPLNFFERIQPLSFRPDDGPSPFFSLSSSASTSFVYKPPTSPLFQSESTEETDRVFDMDGIDLAYDVTRQQRRHTVPSPLPGVHGYSPSLPQKQSSSLRQERAFPYQAHQPRRSLASAAGLSLSGSLPQTPASLRSRRPSFSSDVSPIQHASMVGSYEESILRGRMSTTPSRPLDFLAQIGVLGLGKCKASLRCPPHVTLPFPAVFYSYASSSHGRSKEDDGPSPYVGQIDIENGLPSQGDDVRPRRKHQGRVVESAADADADADADAMDTYHIHANLSSRDVRKAQRARRRSGSPRAPPGGSYRIPEKGQVQIIIKNPNKTAVKLFLVPYDLTGMEPGSKTFVRQRSYSNGPIIDNMPDSKGNSSMDRPILRYLVHLHICCPSRGRFYLYKNIRVVFANRVPDGKERLRNEITLPEPKFTPYKPIRVVHQPLSKATGLDASLAADTAFRRRSVGLCYGEAGHVRDVNGGFVSPTPTGHPLSYGLAGDGHSGEPVFGVSASHTRGSIVDGRSALAVCPLETLGSSHTSRSTVHDSNNVSNWVGYNSQMDKYDKLNKGDVGYGGNAFANLINGNPAVAESLLSQRLRSLGVQIPGRGEGEEFPKPAEAED